MAFVNEIVPETDIEQFGLDEIRKKYDPWSWRDGRPTVFTHTWTVDRERDLYLIPVKSFEEVGQSGRPQSTHKGLWLLGYRGTPVEFVLNRGPGSSSLSADSPYRIVWELLGMDASQVKGALPEELVEVLKQALTVYGHMGHFLQIPNTSVEFTF